MFLEKEKSYTFKFDIILVTVIESSPRQNQSWTKYFNYWMWWGFFKRRKIGPTETLDNSFSSNEMKGDLGIVNVSYLFSN